MYKILILLVLLVFTVGSVQAEAVGSGLTEQVTIQGKSFYKDGKPWLPKGVTVEGFNRPANLLDKASMQGRGYYGATELNAVRQKFGADTIRIQVSQPGLDPQSSIYNSAYLQELLDAIKLARSSGFVVIISMDAQAENGIPNLPCMPNDSTARAWRMIAPSFVHDAGVIFEPFNEPCKFEGNPKNKTEWAQSMQPIMNELRELGSTNVLLLDGLGFGHATAGLFPLVHDGLPNHLAMSVHPYLNKGNYVTVEQWRAEFGNDAEHYPTLAGEWNATSTNGCVDETTPQLALSLMHYLESLHIGLIGWGIDSNYGKLVQDHTGYEPTDYTSFTGCSKTPTQVGGGRLVANYPND